MHGRQGFAYLDEPPDSCDDATKKNKAMWNNNASNVEVEVSKCCSGNHWLIQTDIQALIGHSYWEEAKP